MVRAYPRINVPCVKLPWLEQALLCGTISSISLDNPSMNKLLQSPAPYHAVIVAAVVVKGGAAFFLPEHVTTTFPNVIKYFNLRDL